ncbi:MAG: hypothetical protein ABFD81_11170 [Syntrophaceae bacterium]
MHRRSRNDWIRFWAGLACMCLLLVVTYSPAQAGMWEADPPMLSGDPQWEKVKVLWQDHAKGENLSEIITILTALKDKYPDKIETYLCLARAHYLHAWYFSKDKRGHFAQAEGYAAQACKMEPGNHYAIRILCETLIWSRDRNYIFTHYGDWLKSVAPVKITNPEALPEMKRYPDWDGFMKLWLARADMEKAKTAAVLVEKMAQEHPRDALAQVWAARVFYYIGEVYTSLGEQNQKAIPQYKKGIAYSEKALKLQPQSQLANFWYVMNLARSIQFTSLINKARFFSELLDSTLLCVKENSSYMFFNVMNLLGTMITNGGWITEKGMRIAGITLQMDLNGLEIAEMLYPDFYYIPYCRADILASKGKKKEALEILEKLLSRNPDANKQIPENRSFQREAKTLYEAIKEGKR